MNSLPLSPLAAADVSVTGSSITVDREGLFAGTISPVEGGVMRGVDSSTGVDSTGDGVAGPSGGYCGG